MKNDLQNLSNESTLVLVNGSAPAVMASLAVNPSELSQTGKLCDLARRQGFQIRNNGKRDGKSQRNMTYNENSIALPSDRGTLEISGANLMYEGARVKSWVLGRDVNPAGRGDGAYYAQGAFSIGSVRPSPTTTPVGGWGNSVNNGCGGGCRPEGKSMQNELFCVDLVSIAARLIAHCHPEWLNMDAI